MDKVDTDLKIKDAAYAVIEDCVKSNADLGTVIYEIGSDDHDFTVKVTFQVKRKKRKNERTPRPKSNERALPETKNEIGKGGGDSKKPVKLPVPN